MSDCEENRPDALRDIIFRLRAELARALEGAK